MAVRDTLQARQAALLVDALPPDARRQVIAKLDAVESSRLQSLLNELAEMGVSRSLGPLPRVLTSPSTLTTQERLAELNVADAVQCLESVAPATAAQLLLASDGSWRTQALDRMSHARRAEVLECLRHDSSPLAPAALRILCERLCTQVARVSADRAAAAESHVASAPANWRVALWKRIKTARGGLFAWTR